MVIDFVCWFRTSSIMASVYELFFIMTCIWHDVFISDLSELYLSARLLLLKFIIIYIIKEQSFVSVKAHECGFLQLGSSLNEKLIALCLYHLYLYGFWLAYMDTHIIHYYTYPALNNSAVNALWFALLWFQTLWALTLFLFALQQHGIWVIAMTTHTTIIIGHFLVASERGSWPATFNVR